jgi:hypothetical protein
MTDYPRMMGVGLAIALVALAGVCDEGASAQAWTADETALARVCTNEAGFTRDGDCPAIGAAIAFHARRLGVTFEEFAKRYSDRAFSRSRTDGRRWIAWLEPTTERPRFWSDRAMRWETGAALWIDRLAQARRILASAEAHACDGTPMHWGARYGVDLDRAGRAIEAGRWRALECGETRNAFYTVIAREDDR